jgi:hypothetical protein
MVRSLLVSLVLVLVCGCDCKGGKLAVVPDAGCRDEVCDGLDNDCDGEVDQGLGETTCGVGACQRTTQNCVLGLQNACAPGLPTEEVCDGLDNDCDGEVDEGFAQVTCGVGACARTVASCLNGAPQTCTPGQPADEVCDGVDNDCDGQVDQGFTALTCGVGGCARTVEACANGVTQQCTPGEPTDELCDGVDNNCDGRTDEGFMPLSCGTGACARTVQACLGGVTQLCTPANPTPEVCDGLDNNCNGQIDEGFAPLSCGVGACARTVAACEQGSLQTCTPGSPTPEVCDGLDNDCDGQVDNGTCRPPQVTCPASLSARVGTAVSLTATASDPDGTVTTTSWTVAAHPTGALAGPTPATTPATSLTPDVAGSYTLSFCATDNDQLTTCCTTSVATTACTTPPSPPASTACGTSWDGRPIVQFAAVPTGLRYELLDATGTTVLASATAGQNYLRPATRVDAGGPPPGTAVTLSVRACQASDPTCCSAATPVQVNVVEVCSTPQTPTSANVVLSEYVTNGDGVCPSSDCATHDTCQAGESVEITNLSNCPVTLDGFHFAYRNASASPGSYRWMNFGPTDVIPPRGVYVAIRNRQYAPLCSAQLPQENPGLYGLKISSLAMQGPNLCSGWFNNTGGGSSELQVAPGAVTATPDFTAAAALTRIAPYVSSSTVCAGIGFDALDSCGSVAAGTAPTTELSPNQLGRLWHPCDAVASPVPACVRD